MEKIYTLVVWIIMFMACRDAANDYPPTEPLPASPLTADEIRSLAVTHVMPYEEALKEVNDFMDGMASTRGNDNRTISEVRVVTNPLRQRAATAGDIRLTDTTLYIFNFDNDQGFAIVSADSRSEGLLALAESGHLGDTVTNPGLAIFMSRIEGYQLEAARKDKALKDSLYQLAKEKVEKLDPQSVTQGNTMLTKSGVPTWTYKERVELPMITKWGQEYPYNIAIPLKNGKLCYAGCVPVAVAQLTVYHQFPQHYNSKLLNMRLMAQYVISPQKEEGEIFTQIDELAQRSIAYIIYNWGKEMGAKWGNSSTPTPSANITPLFKKLGYQNPGVRLNYNLDIIVNSLKNNNPCLIEGYSTINNKEGHEWIIEGYSKEYRYVEYKTPEGYPIWQQEYRDLVRCNYGWNGACDGYFLSKVFDLYNDPIEPGKEVNWGEPSPYSKSITPYSYQYNLHIIPNIHP